MGVILWDVRGGVFLVLLAPGRACASICTQRRNHWRKLGYLVYGSQKLNGALSKIGSWDPDDERTPRKPKKRRTNMPLSLLPAPSRNGREYAVGLDSGQIEGK